MNMKKDRDLCHRHRSCYHGLGFATLLIIAGVLLLCTKLNFIPARYIDALISWQMLVILIGVVSLVKGHFYSAVVFITAGTFFIIPEIGKVSGNFIGTVPPNFLQLYWPALLIVAGILVVIHRIFPPIRKFNMMEERFRMHAEAHGRGDRFKHSHRWETEDGFVNKSSIFESGEHIVLDPEFKGGSIDTVFGETKLDLRKTNLPEGTTRLDINVVFGSVNIYVPADWRVQLNVNSVFGAFEDKRPFKDADTDPSRTLKICGDIVFGGGELKN